MAFWKPWTSLEYVIVTPPPGLLLYFWLLLLVSYLYHSFYQVSQAQVLRPGRIREEVKQSWCMWEGTEGSVACRAGSPSKEGPSSLLSRPVSQEWDTVSPASLSFPDKPYTWTVCEVSPCLMWATESTFLYEALGGQSKALCYQSVTTSALTIRISWGSLLINLIIFSGSR